MPMMKERPTRLRSGLPKGRRNSETNLQRGLAADLMEIEKPPVAYDFGKPYSGKRLCPDVSNFCRRNGPKFPEPSEALGWAKF